MNTPFHTLFKVDQPEYGHKITAIYIACYLGKGKQREERWEIFLKQIAEFKDIEVNVVNMEFTGEEWDIDVNFINPGNKQMYSWEARNVCYKHLYESDHDFGFIADNDAWIDHDAFDGHSGKAVADWNNHKHSSDFSAIDIWAPTFGAMNAGAYGNKKHFEHHLCFQRKYTLKGSIRAMRNIKKHYGKEIYVPDMGDNCQGEELLHQLYFLREGYGCYVYYNAALKEECCGENSFYSGEKLEDRDIPALLQNVLKYSGSWIGLKDKGHLDLTRYNKRLLGRPPLLLIEKS